VKRVVPRISILLPLHTEERLAWLISKNHTSGVASFLKKPETRVGCDPDEQSLCLTLMAI